MKCVVVLLLCVSAAYAQSSIGAAIPATRLESESGLSLPGSSSISLSGSLSLGSSSGSSGSSGCVDANPCNNPIQFNNNKNDPAAGLQNVDEAIKPVEDWLKDFQKRSLGEGSDLYKAAKATVRPLLMKLQRTMQRAQERLRDSNNAILRHVEESTINHVYALLKADRQKSQQEERKEEMAAKIMEAKRTEKETREVNNARLGITSEQASALDSALKSTGVAPSQSVMSKIQSLISSAGASASQSISEALSKALSESSGKSSSGSGSSK
jgi:hypothetical protein